MSVCLNLHWISCFYNPTATGKPQQQEVSTAVDQNINIKIPPPILPPTFISQQPQQQAPEFESQPTQNPVGQDTVVEYPNYEDYADDYNYINNDAANTAGVNNDKERPNVLESKIYLTI